jgi:bifunctional UDP-N-acetylglucosamine pyrophosphorylase/glucosamine-1-phosphate N-acetyltransferase
MSVAALILPVDSPLRAHRLVGQWGTSFARGVAEELVAHVHHVSSGPQNLASVYQTWLDQGVRHVLLLPDNRPLLTPELLSELLTQAPASLTVLRDGDGQVAAGCAQLDWLTRRLPGTSGELDLETLAAGARASGRRCGDTGACLAVWDLASLAEAERLLRRRINRRWMAAGVRLVDPATTYIDAAVQLGAGSTILPNTHLWGVTRIGEGCLIGPNAMVRDSQIGDFCTIKASMVEEAVMEDHSDIGPYGHLRKGARLCRGAHMGNYGEMKNSTLGPGSKMGHFGYLGDATVGENVNIGAGTITCNYDGERKHKTVIHDGAFIGSDTMLVAPVEIGAGARIGAGSVVTHDVPAGAVAYGVPARVQRMMNEGEVDGPGK